MTKDDMVKYITSRMDECLVALVMKNNRICRYTYNKDIDGDRLLQLGDDLIDEDIDTIYVAGRPTVDLENSVCNFIFKVTKMPDKIDWIYHGVDEISSLNNNVRNAI